MTLSLWHTNYTGSPWAGETSAGTSDTVDLVEFSGSAPATATIDGRGVPNFNGSSHWMWSSPTTVDDVIGTQSNAGTAFSIVFIVQMDTEVADSPQTYNLPGIFATHNTGAFAVGFSDAGLRVRCDAGGGDVAELTVGTVDTSGPFLCAITHDGTTLRVYVDDMTTPAASDTVGLPSSGTPVLKFGTNWNQTAHTDGKLPEPVMAKNICFDTTVLGDVKSYMQATYPSLGL